MANSLWSLQWSFDLGRSVGILNTGDGTTIELGPTRDEGLLRKFRRFGRVNRQRSYGVICAESGAELLIRLVAGFVRLGLVLADLIRTQQIFQVVETREVIRDALNDVTANVGSALQCSVVQVMPPQSKALQQALGVSIMNALRGDAPSRPVSPVEPSPSPDAPYSAEELVLLAGSM